MAFKEFLEKYQKVPIEEYPNRVLESVPEPMVSCKVSTYQHVSYIKQCLDGILMQQTDFPIEIVIGEDESIDGTREICIEYAQRYPGKIRLFLHRRENNILRNGRPSARFQSTYTRFNCRGKYIATCEGDDFWTDPLKLQKQVDFMEENEDCSMCYHGVRHVFMTANKSDKIVKEKTDLNLKFTSEEFIRSKYARTVTILYRSLIIINYPKWAYQSPIGDYPLQMICALHGNIGYIGGLPMAVYRVGVSGSSNHGRFGTKEERKQWIKKRLYNYKISRDLFNKNSDYKYDAIIQKQKQMFSLGMLLHGLNCFKKAEIFELYREYIPEPLKINKPILKFWFHFFQYKKQSI